MNTTRLLLGTLVAIGVSASAVADSSSPSTVTLHTLSMTSANKLVMAAASDCARRGFLVAAAVVDRSGRLLAFVRDPFAGPHTIDVARLKAYTAITFQAPTSTLADRQELRFIPDIILLGGGVPINVAGHIYGAVGVSGAPAEQVSGDIDEKCAWTGVGAIRDDLEFGDQ